MSLVLEIGVVRDRGKGTATIIQKNGTIPAMAWFGMARLNPTFTPDLVWEKSFRRTRRRRDLYARRRNSDPRPSRAA